MSLHIIREFYVHLQFLPFFSQIKLSYGQTKTVRLTLGCEYEIVESLKAHQEPWSTIPEADLQRSIHECPLDHCPSVEVTTCHTLLRQNLQFFIPPDCLPEQIPEVLRNTENILPVIVYAITEETFDDTVSFMLCIVCLLKCDVIECRRNS